MDSLRNFDKRSEEIIALLRLRKKIILRVRITDNSDLITSKNITNTPISITRLLKDKLLAPRISNNSSIFGFTFVD